MPRDRVGIIIILGELRRGVSVEVIMRGTLQRDCQLRFEQARELVCLGCVEEARGARSPDEVAKSCSDSFCQSPFVMAGVAGPCLIFLDR